MTDLRRNDLLYPELSYKIMGCAYDVYNELGAGHHEKYYQRAMALLMKERNINFTEQLYAPLKFHDTVIGKLFFDFLVEEKVVVELKKGNTYSKRHIDQVLEYLKANNLQLAIIINFGSDKVHSKRIINQVQ
jgi:GxxExxY protein